MNTINKYLTFSTKQQYLNYRTEWKFSYKSLSIEIRNFKREIHASCHHITWSEYSQLLKLKLKATEMLQELKEAKILAQEQYQASHK